VIENQLRTPGNHEVSRLSRVPITQVAGCEAHVPDGAADARPRTYDDRAQDRRGGSGGLGPGRDDGRSGLRSL